MRKRVLFESLLAIIAVLLIFTIYLMVSGYAFTTTETQATVKWDAASNDTIYYITACNDGTLRALMDNHVEAIDQYGAPMWSVDIPDKWWTGSKYVKPAVAVADDGTLYVYLRANVTMAAIENQVPYTYADDYLTDKDDQNQRLMDAYAGTEFAASLDERVIAIAPNGSIMWSRPLPTKLYAAAIEVKNDTVYVYHGFNETALDRNGSVLWDFGDVGAAPVVDDAGHVYSVEPIHYGDRDPSRSTLSGVVEARYPNGTLYWRHDIGEATYVQQVEDTGDTMPLYDHNTLYLPLLNGIYAMDRDGSIKWVKHYNVSTVLFNLAPFDTDGNVYIRTLDAGQPAQDTYDVMGETYTNPTPYDNYPVYGTNISILKPDGSELALTNDTNAYSAAGYGIGYEAVIDYPQNNRSLGTLIPAGLTARDLKENRDLWSYNFTPMESGTSVINETNVKSLFLPDDVNNVRRLYGTGNLDLANLTPFGINGNAVLQVLPGKDVTYVGFWTYNYEEPAIYNKSRVDFFGGLYAFDNDGRLLWSRPLDSMISSMYQKDGTIYYSTGSGRVSAAQVNVVTGLALAAVLYLFIRFVIIGSISRARSAINKNDNRNAVFKQVVEHPGSTMYEISRSLGINKGTVRYHLFILAVNHRITSRKADKKYVRYFPNSNTYTSEEQQIMSLLKRDAIRNVLKALVDRPGLSNVQLSKELNVPESAMSKHMKELYTRGIVDKQRMAGGVSYTIKAETKNSIVKALQHINQ